MNAISSFFHGFSHKKPPEPPVNREKNLARTVDWVHGTQVQTLVAMVNSDQMLKPSGVLRSEGRFAFCGENGKHIFGVNATMISGVALRYADGAIDYAAYGGAGYSDYTAGNCFKNPEKMIRAMANQIEEWKPVPDKYPDTDRAQNYAYLDCGSLSNTYASECAAPHLLYNFHRHMRILNLLEPEQFKEIIIPKVKEMLGVLQEIFEHPPPDDIKICYKEGPAKYTQIQGLAKDLIDKMFTPVLSLPDEKCPYDERDKRIMRLCIPIVFGAAIQQPQNIEPIDSSIDGELGYAGSLKLGKEIPIVFVPLQHQAAVKEYLREKKVENVTVSTFDVLQDIAH